MNLPLFDLLVIVGCIMAAYYFGYLDGRDDSMKSSKANARLIDAAPDLLDACRVALGHLTGGMDGDWRNCDAADLLRATIKKALGE